MTVEEAVEELIVTLQGLYNRKSNFTWMEARPLLEQLLERFKAECFAQAEPELLAAMVRLQSIVDRYEYRDAIDGKNGAAIRAADAAKN